MINKENFSLNHILSPSLSIKNFIKLSKKTGTQNIEIRNDLPNIKIVNEDPYLIKKISTKLKIKILTINALQKFNIWNKEREEELLFLCNFAKKCNCKGIVLVPLNTGDYTEYKERKKLLNNSLKNIEVILNEYGLTGYVEPLGFKTSSLSLKIEVAEAIDLISSKSTLKIMHDTFHHFLSGEENIYPKLTGLVHISGVSNNKLKISEMRDDDRELIDEKDIIKNLDQMKSLITNGYKGIFSFEPFSKKIQNIDDPSSRIINNIEYLINNY